MYHLHILLCHSWLPRAVPQFLSQQPIICFLWSTQWSSFRPSLYFSVSSSRLSVRLFFHSCLCIQVPPFWWAGFLLFVDTPACPYLQLRACSLRADCTAHSPAPLDTHLDASLPESSLIVTNESIPCDAHSLWLPVAQVLCIKLNEWSVAYRARFWVQNFILALDTPPVLAKKARSFSGWNHATAQWSSSVSLS